MIDSVATLARRSSRFPRLAAQIVRWGVPPRSLLFGPLSLGDDLLCTAVLREARLRGEPLTMFTQRPELFENNPDPARVLPIDDYFVAAIRRMGRTVIQPYYVRPDPTHADRDLLPTVHVIAEMCRQAGISGKVRLRPYLHLTEEEKNFGAFFPRQIALQSSGLRAAIPYRNKEWGPEKFAAVAQKLSSTHRLVQLGSADDLPLPVDVDLRGKTSFRQAAAVLANSTTFVGLEGFLVHLARAVDCPAVVVAGGRAHPAAFGYTANINLRRSPPCSPCGLRNTCEFQLACMTDITPHDVVNAVNEMLQRDRAALPVEEVEVQ